ncbi:response regulator [Treponema sp. Marseille-Q4130]|uniref:response regulator transcription factor n=1 Tax=Treponema sp. Marseille-Q4130 TaxID=2766702 RepID=UPI001651DFF2|nr:response regulator [Treponema sp. Marseille-Q4130]MBC6719856.1 response regulator [Treponema sp. Marseille-Q4130]
MRMFPWENENCTLVGEAPDGADGLALAKKLMPDIVFTDIRMPGMNGLEFADAFREIHSNALIIVFTGYSEFSYAQKALRIGVFDFLVKPVSVGALRAVLKKAAKFLDVRCMEGRRTRELTDTVKRMKFAVQEQLLSDALRGVFKFDKNTVSADDLNVGHFVVAAVSGDGEKKLETYVLRDSLLKVVKKANECNLLRFEFERYVLLFCFPREIEAERCRKYVLQTLEEAQLSVWKRFNFSFSAGISLADDDIFSLPQLKRQALHVLRNNLLHGKNSVSRFERKDTAPIVFADFETQKIQILSAIQARDRVLLVSEFEKLVMTLTTNTGNSEQICENIRDVLVEVAFLTNSDMPIGDYVGKKAADYVCEVKDELLRIFHRLQVQDGEMKRDIATIVENYIKEHYAENISLTTLSERLCYNTAYLSKLIRKNCKRNFMDMLIRTRMEKAKELLRTTEETIARIAAKVGYNDEGYFITAFKKETGCSPADFRLRRF